MNNAFVLPDDLTDPKPFWEKPLSNWEMVDVGVRSNFASARLAAQIMVPQGSGLIVATSGYVGVTYTYGVVFGLCKTAVDRMARDMAIELQPHNVASVSLWQGLTMTERAQRNLNARPEMTKSIVTRPALGCSPEFPGRVIAALATDSDLTDLSGGTFITAELAQRYGITDVDGKIIPSLRAERGSPIWQPIREQAMDADQLARFERLLTRQDITDCLTRFCRGIDRFDRDLFLSAFHPDAEVAAGDFVGGPADLYEWAPTMHAQAQIATQHNLLNNTCDVDGEIAHSETYYLFVGRNRDDTNWIAGLAATSTGWSAGRARGGSRCAPRGPSGSGLRPHHADPVRGRAGHRSQRRFSTGPDRRVLSAATCQSPRPPQPAHLRWGLKWLMVTTAS